MRVLAFDCAGGQCAAALLADDRIVATRGVISDRGHAQVLLPLLVGMLDEAGLGFGEIDRFAVTTGPGSFTGIRVALAAARGLAMALKKPVVGITVFEAMAMGAVELGFATPRLLVAIESRRAECFTQLFDHAGRQLGEPAMLAPQDVAAWSGPGELSLSGDAARRVAPFYPADAPIVPTEQVDVAILARLAAERDPGPAPAPFYLRAADALPARGGKGAS